MIGIARKRRERRNIVLAVMASIIILPIAALLGMAIGDAISPDNGPKLGVLFR